VHIPAERGARGTVARWLPHWTKLSMDILVCVGASHQSTGAATPYCLPVTETGNAGGNCCTAGEQRSGSKRDSCALSVAGHPGYAHECRGGDHCCVEDDVVVYPRSGMEHRVRVLAGKVGTDGDGQVQCAVEAARDDVEVASFRGLQVCEASQDVEVLHLVLRACALRGILREVCPRHEWARSQSLEDVRIGSTYEQCPCCDDLCLIAQDELALVMRGNAILFAGSVMAAGHIPACSCTLESV
jgi:hypothetical protein